MKTPIFTLLASAGLAAATAGLVVAGPVTPPAGPVASSYKTLAEVEPRIAINAVNTPGDADSTFKITLPGSYYLTEQIGALPGKHGIEIVADNVTIDLNGFRVGGYPGAGDGIRATGQAWENITIHNGTIGPFEGAGIFVSGGIGVNLDGTRLYDLSISNCHDGVLASGWASIRNVNVSKCATEGIYCSGNSVISDCLVSQCDNGILANKSSVVERCVLDSNVGNGISAGEQCVLRHNTCSNNGSDGIGAGINITGGDGTRIEGNHCTQNPYGIRVNSGRPFLFGNTCAKNAVSWFLNSGTVHGPIVDRTSPGSPPVVGNSGPDTSGTTHPFANFTY